LQEAQELAEMHARTGDGNRKLDSALYRRSGEVAWWLGNTNAIETRFGPTRDDESEPPPCDVEETRQWFMIRSKMILDATCQNVIHEWGCTAPPPFLS